jgi:hypothetical protein
MPPVACRRRVGQTTAGAFFGSISLAPSTSNSPGSALPATGPCACATPSSGRPPAGSTMCPTAELTEVHEDHDLLKTAFAVSVLPVVVGEGGERGLGFPWHIGVGGSEAAPRKRPGSPRWTTNTSPNSDGGPCTSGTPAPEDHPRPRPLTPDPAWSRRTRRHRRDTSLDMISTLLEGSSHPWILAPETYQPKDATPRRRMSVPARGYTVHCAELRSAE